MTKQNRQESNVKKKFKNDRRQLKQRLYVIIILYISLSEPNIAGGSEIYICLYKKPILTKIPSKPDFFLAPRGSSLEGFSLKKIGHTLVIRELDEI